MIPHFQSLKDLVAMIQNVSVSTQQSTRPKEMAIDGDVTSANGWSAGTYANPKWFRIDFKDDKIVYHVDILPRCSLGRQSKGYTISYNGGFMEVSKLSDNRKYYYISSFYLKVMKLINVITNNR